MSENSEEDKEHEPSLRRLEEARKRGEIAQSADLTAAAGYAGLLLAALIFGAAALQKAGLAGAVILGQADRLAPQIMTSARAPIGGIMAAFTMPLAPILLLPMVAALLAVVVQQALVFAPGKLAPKLSRISPFATAKQKFGREGLFAFAKNVVKLAIICLLLLKFLPSRADEILSSLQMTPAQATVVMLNVLIDFLFFALVIATILGTVDYFWQYFQHRRRNRMSRKDLIDEMKDTEGDPYVKMQRRQRGQEIALNQMLQDVAKADVIVVNPTHYAVALKWSRAKRSAPICVAKGVDEIAARIRERAAEAGVPIHRDPPTARAIHASVEIGDQIRAEHFQAVAAAIRFAEAMRKRARSVMK